MNRVKTLCIYASEYNTHFFYLKLFLCPVDLKLLWQLPKPTNLSLLTHVFHSWWFQPLDRCTWRPECQCSCLPSHSLDGHNPCSLSVSTLSNPVCVNNIQSKHFLFKVNSYWLKKKLLCFSCIPVVKQIPTVYSLKSWH